MKKRRSLDFMGDDDGNGDEFTPKGSSTPTLGRDRYGEFNSNTRMWVAPYTWVRMFKSVKDNANP